jgi:hypothetical protein
MKRLQRLVATLCMFLGMVVMGGWSGQPVMAAEFVASSCPLAAAHGSYEFVAPAAIYVAPGTVIAIPDHLLYASPAAFAGKGTLIFAGTGQIILSATETLNGSLASPVRYYANYTINTNCTATATFANGAQLGLKMVGNGKTQALVSTTPGFVILRSAQTSGQ